MVKLTKQEAMELIKVGEATWNRHKNKAELFAQYGYELVGEEKVGRSKLFFLEQPQNKHDEIKRNMRELFKFSAAFNMDAFLEMVSILYTSENPVSNVYLSNKLGVSRRTISTWKAELIDKGLFVEVRTASNFIKYYKDDFLSTKATAEEWSAYYYYCGGFPSFREGALEHYKEHGYMMYRTNLLEANVFANSFFKLVQELY